MNAFNYQFGSIFDNPGLDHWKVHSLSPTKGSDKIDNIFKCYKNHPRINNIKTKFSSVRSFSFQSVSVNEIMAVLRDMKNNESVGGKIPIQISKESEFIFEILTKCINKFIQTGCFLDSLKEANITLVFKKDDLLDRSNYGSVSTQALILKVYEKRIYNQLTEYAESFLSHILCRFRKAHSTQHAHFKLL